MPFIDNINSNQPGQNPKLMPGDENPDKQATGNPGNDVAFPGQYPDENILLIKRRHPITQLGLAIYILAMFLLPVFVYLVLNFFWQIPLNGILLKLFLFTTSLYLLFLLVVSFYMLIDYYLDVWIVTNQRIISIEQKGLFRRTVTELRYNRIEDITSEVEGLINTYFQFGDILIQTAAESERMILKQVPNPVETRRIIAEAYKKATDGFDRPPL